MLVRGTLEIRRFDRHRPDFGSGARGQHLARGGSGCGRSAVWRDPLVDLIDRPVPFDLYADELREMSCSGVLVVILNSCTSTVALSAARLGE